MLGLAGETACAGTRGSPCFKTLASAPLQDVTLEQSKALKSVAKGLEAEALSCAMALENAHG